MGRLPIGSIGALLQFEGTFARVLVHLVFTKTPAVFGFDHRRLVAVVRPAVEHPGVDRLGIFILAGVRSAREGEDEQRGDGRGGDQDCFRAEHEVEREADEPQFGLVAEVGGEGLGGFGGGVDLFGHTVPFVTNLTALAFCTSLCSVNHKHPFLL